MGNKYGISDFECDECNSLFAKYESHLCYYLGLSQTLSGSISRKGIPTLKSSKKDLEIRAMRIYGIDGIMIQKTSHESKAIEWSEDDTISITFSKGSYKPTSVYKILLKIALSSLPIEEITHYRTAFNFILQQNTNLAGMATVGIFEFEPHIVHQLPFGYLFKKKLPTALVPTHQFALYFQNRIVTFCLPYNSSDEGIGLFNGQKREVLIAPPLSTAPVTGNIPFRYTTLDLSSNDLVKGEEQIMNFKLNSEQIKNGIRIDPKTGERATSTLEEQPGAKGIFLVPRNTVIPFDSFKQNPPPKMCYE